MQMQILSIKNDLNVNNLYIQYVNEKRVKIDLFTIVELIQNFKIELAWLRNYKLSEPLEWMDPLDQAEMSLA